MFSRNSLLPGPRHRLTESENSRVPGAPGRRWCSQRLTTNHYDNMDLLKEQMKAAMKIAA